MRRNADEGLRHLERAAAAGDPDAIRAWLSGMERAGRFQEVPIGYSQYMTQDQLLKVMALNRGLAMGGLVHWLHISGDRAMALHRQWAGEGAFGPRRTEAQLRLLTRFAQWARAWIALLFVRDVMEARNTSEAEEAAWMYEDTLIVGSHTIGPRGAEEVAPIRNRELDPLVTALFG